MFSYEKRRFVSVSCPAIRARAIPAVCALPLAHRIIHMSDYLRFSSTRTLRQGRELQLLSEVACTRQFFKKSAARE